MFDDETPCQCPKCGWLGLIRDAEEFRSYDQAPLPLRQVCPRCTHEVDVQKLGQKGLDGLRREHDLLLKLDFRGDLSPEAKAERRMYLEHFFEHIDQPIG